jgi:ankyrin repeat protein
MQEVIRLTIIRLRWQAIFLGITCLMSLSCAARPADAPTPEGAQRFLKLRGYEFTKAGFFTAVAERDVAAVNAFLTGGFDPNLRGESDGRTALISAAARGHLEIVNALLEGRADVNIKDNVGYTAFFHAIEARYDDVADALISQTQLDLNARGKNGVTALMVYVWRDRKDAVAKLLNRGADVTLTDNDGDTALHGAAEMGNVEMARMLLAKGANVNAKNKVGGTPLMWGAVFGHDEVVRELLQHGADPSLKDEDGVTALQWAVKNNRTNVVRVLQGR